MVHWCVSSWIKLRGVHYILLFLGLLMLKYRLQIAAINKVSRIRMAYWFRYEESWEKTHYGVAEARHYSSHLERTGCWNEQHTKVSVVEHRTEHCEEIPKYFIYRPVETYCWICDYHEYTYLKEYIWNLNDHLPQGRKIIVFTYMIKFIKHWKKYGLWEQ